MDVTELSSSLRYVVSALHRALRKQIHAASAYSMTEIETIGRLYVSGPLLPTELAAHARITTQSMSQIIKKMEGAGIVTRAQSADDRRKVYISLTPFGKQMVEETRYNKDEWLKHAIDNLLSANEKELLAAAMPALNKLIQTK